MECVNSKWIIKQFKINSSRNVCIHCFYGGFLSYSVHLSSMLLLVLSTKYFLNCFFLRKYIQGFIKLDNKASSKNVLRVCAWLRERPDVKSSRYIERGSMEHRKMTTMNTHSFDAAKSNFLAFFPLIFIENSSESADVPLISFLLLKVWNAVGL